MLVFKEKQELKRLLLRKGSVVWANSVVLPMDKPKKRSKYGNKRTKVDGIWFDSKLEAGHYTKLRAAEKAKAIRNLITHPKYPIYIAGILICHVELDFVYEDVGTGQQHYIDVKGKDNQLSQLKRKMLEASKGIKVEVWKA